MTASGIPVGKISFLWECLQLVANLAPETLFEGLPSGIVRPRLCLFIFF